MENQNFYTVNPRTEIQFLKGVGPKRGSILNSFGIHTIKDLIRHFPRKYLDRTNRKKISDIFAIRGLFFIMAFYVGLWAIRIPTIKDQVQSDYLGNGFIMATFAIGSIIAMIFYELDE